jgi:hypothetical protein
MVLIYGEARGYSEPARQMYGEKFPMDDLVNVVQHFRDFERSNEREDRILVAEKDIFRRILNRVRLS